jgi:hypothetical protein
MTNTCKHVFTNNSKTHKKNEVCGSVIRKKGSSYSWKHQQNDSPQNDNIQSDQLIVRPENNFIQLENSQNKV